MKRQTISLCMITLDEADYLRRALGSVVSHVQEIIVVDGGSEDRTVEIAKSFGAKVYRRQWDGHFGNQRNVAIRKATKDWILFMDADEVYEKRLVSQLPELVNNTLGIDAVDFPRKNYQTDGTFDELKGMYPDYQRRLFRNNGRIRYYDSIHEVPRNYRRLLRTTGGNIIHRKSAVRSRQRAQQYGGYEEGRLVGQVQEAQRKLHQLRGSRNKP